MAKPSYSIKKTPTRDVQGGNFNHVGILDPVGLASNVALSIGPNTIVALYNSANQAHYVATGTASVSAPSDGLTGVAIPPNSYIFINTGADHYIRTNSSGVYAYIVIDEVNPSND
jgi:hypothetical protein